jgi:hypothetical protein
MPWEKRDSKGLYYTVTISREGNPKRLYFGRPDSPPAELAAAIVGIRAIDQELNRRYWRGEQIGLTDEQKSGIDAMSRFFVGDSIPSSELDPADSPPPSLAAGASLEPSTHSPSFQPRIASTVSTLAE